MKHIQIVFMALLFLISSSVVSADSYFDSEEHDRVMDIQIAEFIEADGDGVYISRGGEIIQDLAKGTKINCNDGIMAEGTNVESFKIKNIKTGTIYEISESRNLALGLLQQDAFLGVPLDSWTIYEDFICVTPSKNKKWHDLFKKDSNCGWIKKKLFGCGRQKDKDKIDNVKGVVLASTGRITIDRGLEILPGIENTKLLPGDTIVVHEGALIEFQLENGKVIKLDSIQKFTIPYEGKKVPKLQKIIGGLWTGMKNLFKAEDRDLKSPTAVAGVRG